MEDSSQKNTRERILTTATALFAESGYTGVSLRAICAAAEVSLPMVAYYFDNKAGLYEAVLESLTAAFDKELDAQNLDSVPVDKKLRVYLETAVRCHLKNPHFSGVFGYEAHPSDILLKVMKSDKNRYFGDYIARLITEVQQGGGLRGDIDPLYAARIVSAIFNSHPTMSNLYEAFYKTRPDSERILDAVIEFCLGALENNAMARISGELHAKASK